jgi:acetyl-CoA carboxylase biotin carboxylase subunit
MISKLSVWAPTRREAIARAQRALSEYVVKGITTNIRYLKAILAHPEFIEGDYDTSFLTREHETLLGAEDAKLSEMALLASAVHAYQRDQKRAKAPPVTPPLRARKDLHALLHEAAGPEGSGAGGPGATGQ